MKVFLHLAVVLALLLQGCAGRLEPQHLPPEESLAPADAAVWETLAKARSGNWFHVLNEGPEALEWRLRAIDSATASIDLQTFIWSLDRSGGLVRQRLLAAAARGVRVRVLVDDSFTASADQSLLELDRHPGVELRVFNPYRHRASSEALRLAFNAGEFWRLDHRMHNKLMLVDGRVAVLGGRNLGDHYFGYDSQDNFRDLELLLGGPVLDPLGREFDDYWNNPWSFPLPALVKARDYPDWPEQQPLAPLASGVEYRREPAAERRREWLDLVGTAQPGAARVLMDLPPADNPTDLAEQPVQLADQLQRLFDEAREELWLISAYLIPTDRLEQAIERALARGVRVRVLTNSINSNNHLGAHAAYSKHLRRLLAMGAEVHEVRADARDRARYMEHPVGDKRLCLHAKLILVDRDLVFAGSFNLDPRSLRLNTEMGLLVESEALNAELRRLLAPDFDEANAWRLSLRPDGRVVWTSGGESLLHQPTHSFMRRLEDWFLAHLPLEGEL